MYKRQLLGPPAQGVVLHQPQPWHGPPEQLRVGVGHDLVVAAGHTGDRDTQSGQPLLGHAPVGQLGRDPLHRRAHQVGQGEVHQPRQRCVLRDPGEEVPHRRPDDGQAPHPVVVQHMTQGQMPAEAETDDAGAGGVGGAAEQIQEVGEHVHAVRSVGEGVLADPRQLGDHDGRAEPVGLGEDRRPLLLDAGDAADDEDQREPVAQRQTGGPAGETRVLERQIEPGDAPDASAPAVEGRHAGLLRREPVRAVDVREAGHRVGADRVQIAAPCLGRHRERGPGMGPGAGPLVLAEVTQHPVDDIAGDALGVGVRKGEPS